MNKEHRDQVFYGGITSANNILTSLANDVFGSTTDANIDLCFQIYLQTWIRSRDGMDPYYNTPSYIKETLCRRCSGVNPNFVVRCVTLSLEEIYRHEPALKERAEAIENLQKTVRENAQKNKAIENLYINDPEYGLVPEKPIYVNGFGSDKQYLSHLHTDEGVQLSFKRVASSEVSGIAGPVDLYQLLLPDGTDYLRVFVCNYGSDVKTIAPRGTKYID